MFKFRYLFLVILIFFSNSVFSREYSWHIRGSGEAFDSPTTACQSFFYADSAPLVGIRKDREDLFYCLFDSTCYGNSPCPATYAARAGDSCPPSTEYNSQTGECKAPVSPPQSFEFLYCYNYDGGDGCAPGTQKGRPDSFCKDGELFEADYSPGTTDAQCYSYRNSDGSSGPAIMCSVTSTSSGQSCGADYSPEQPNNACPEGTKGGVVNGKKVCLPSGDGGETGGGETGGDGDGGGNEGGETGGGESGGGEEGGGEEGGGDSGSGGNSGGGNSGGNGNGNGTGDGDGSGGTGGNGNGSGTGGTGDGDGEGEEGSPSGEGVENCTDGRCGFGDERANPFGGEVRSFSDSMAAFYDGISSSPISSSINNIQFPTGGTCPVGSTDISFGFGSFKVDFSEHCNFWQQISPIISAAFLALWAVVAVRVFLSA